MNVRQDIGFKNSGREICPSVIKIEQDDHGSDDESLQAVIEENSSQTCGEIARQFNASSETVRLHLHRLGYCPAQLKTTYAPTQVMLCVWWTCRQVVHYELQPTSQTVTANLYSQQLERLQQALHQKKPALINRKGVLLLHDNARPMSRGWPGIRCSDLVGRFCAILLTHLTFHHQITISSINWTIIFVVNPSSMKQTCARLSRNSLRPPPPSFTARGLINGRHVGRRCRMPMVTTSRTNNRLHCLYVMFFWVIKNGKNFFAYLVKPLMRFQKGLATPSSNRRKNSIFFSFSAFQHENFYITLFRTLIK
ncbi:uncharacterized protein TNCV_1485721 [Trichonephila clavipes]|nr:uncharacterized protein TNCV_1485721 [Trichonephila clavipes]